MRISHILNGLSYMYPISIHDIDDSYVVEDGNQ